ncbi:allene oxide synthase 3-like [Populus alba x Populus x berolinensis]|uniref:Allene oxide synthase 3-like n=1 Tax=Populus alba x Populus x berolinensis TaxID=444605 RepID=A0AAD6R2Y5_9ROSI|nr:allene oxide synthase 3-like [Populus alba x Populus x berolinensis]
MFPPRSAVPLKPIPGSYGLPFFGAIKDRLDYFYNQGKDEFFSSRVEKYKSTVFKTNMPPGPFIAQNPRVIAVLDAISFPILFDTSKIEKFNVLDGTYLPSLSFTGGYRVCAYLDPSEPNHTSLKSLFMSVLASKHKDFVPLFRTCLSQMFIDIEDEMGSKRTANFNDPSDAMSFNFVFRLFCEKDPSETKLGSEGPAMVDKWVGLQLVPLATIGLPKFLKYFEDLLIHTFPIPFFLVKSDYKKLYDAFYASSSSFLDKAESFGIDRDEACHNLVFVAGEKLHSQLANEIRTVVKEEGGVTFQALEKMTLTKSVVFEALRIEPGVPFQYGKAKEDIVINSHDAAYEIKKGEMIFGYQPFATKDPKIFDHPEERESIEVCLLVKRAGDGGSNCGE